MLTVTSKCFERPERYGETGLFRLVRKDSGEVMFVQRVRYYDELTKKSTLFEDEVTSLVLDVLAQG